ncbi:coiled-coil domain-containing protein 160 [Aplysia californica]|uniref:Coiled-coil domain-containing protein 160 n=1 Tax=Aplysia californica TaxID=6500 RepID=A0ABM1A9I4_APLCA|nr:coiled-coil domain-containing protein 160 [Aplysia californica]
MKDVIQRGFFFCIEYIIHHTVMDPKDIVNENGTESSRVPGDWVKELFAPIYDFDAIVTAGRQGYGGSESKIQRVPILDPQTVREVFERVHERVVEAERQKQHEAEQEKQEVEDKKIDPRKSAIWNTEEIETLRKVYKSAKGEIGKLEAALREKRSHAETLERTVRQQREELDTLHTTLLEVTKANQRLTIHRDHLRKQNSVLDLKCAALSDSWIEIGKEKLKALEAVKEAHKALDKERLQRQKLEADLSEARQNLIREKALVERNVTTKFEIEVNDLNEVIRDLTVELREERKLHEASRRGLEHLRNHFSSLPTRDVLPPGLVLEDQVQRVDHCSL